MLRTGAEARPFAVPAVVDGDIERLSLDSYLGEQIVVLAFYPGDFNPACGEQSDLVELDLFALQPDVVVLAVSPDTVYSHRQFASRYDLDATLCSDTRGEVATAYDVQSEDEYGQFLPRRAAYVIDLDGVIQYAWSTQDLHESYDAKAIQQAVADIGGNQAAVSRYRVGHAHYVEGRRGFTSAMAALEDTDWIVARSDFQRACEEFKTADDHFGTATRYVDDEQLAEHFGRAGTKATALWQAADWLASAADAFASGNGEEGKAYRQDAQAPLETAQDVPTPIDPDDIVVEDEGISIPDAYQAESDESVIDAIRNRLDGIEPAGGSDFDAGDAAGVDGGTSAATGPDTEAARRLRECAGVGMDIDDPTGAGDEQVADALESTAEDFENRQSTSAATGRSADWSASSSSASADAESDGSAATPNTGRDSAAETDQSEAETPVVTDEEIEAIAEELASDGSVHGEDDDGPDDTVTDTDAADSRE